MSRSASGGGNATSPFAAQPDGRPGISLPRPPRTDPGEGTIVSLGDDQDSQSGHGTGSGALPAAPGGSSTESADDTVAADSTTAGGG